MTRSAKFEAKFKNARYPSRSGCFPGWSIPDIIKYEVSTRGAVTAALDTKAGFSRGNGVQQGSRSGLGVTCQP